MTKKASDTLSALGQSLKSVVKLLLHSRPSTARKAKPQGDTLIVLGNGPSLSQTIEQSMAILKKYPTMAVNFAANAQVFFDLKPRYYVLVDPHFFSGKDEPNLHNLWSNLQSVTWEMTLIVPVERVKNLPSALTSNPKVSVVTINALAVEGLASLTDTAYSQGWGMPRPRNVLIPAIMSAILIGYKNIYITGADHSWMSTISVNERNEVISVQPHFYKEDDREVRRINTEYLHYPLHQIIHSFYVAFKSYHDIEAYAVRHGINIYNATPGSFIDAFPRKPLPDA